MKKASLFCAASLCLVSLAQEALAYDKKSCNGNTRKWVIGAVRYAYHDDTRPDNVIDYRRILIEAANEINNIPGTDFRIEIVDPSKDVEYDNGQNDISFGPLSRTATTITLGNERTRTRSPCRGTYSARFRESDITFNDNVSWNDAPIDTQFSGSPYNFRIVALHELIHGTGFGHENNVIAVMNEKYSNGGTVGYQHLATPYADDVSGVKRVYNKDASGIQPRHDVHVSKFKKVPSFDQAVLNRVKRASNNAEVTTLFRGQAYFVDYLVENVGTFDEQNIDLSFYLSNDGYITTSDFRVGGLVLNMDARTSRQSSAYVTIPADAPTGSLYLGYVATLSGPEPDREDNRVHLNLPNGGGRFNVR